MQHAAAEPSLIGPYRLDRELGSGGMGKVYAATVVADAPGVRAGDVVAVKVVHPHLVESPRFLERFLREGEIGKAVAHENVVRTYDCGSADVGGRRVDFLSMEFVEGRTLRDLLAELERVPEELCRHIGREVARGLAAIHAAGAIHRDMKPENVLITRDHVVKVMDLGVARLQEDAARLSQTGSFVGSIHYAAPECFRDGGRGVDGRADLHSLGLTLYELACGVNPYHADEIPQILRRVLHEEPRRLGDANPQVSPFFEEAVHCLLAKDPGARFPDAASLAEALDAGEASPWWEARSRAIVASTRRPLRRIRIPRETAVYGREGDLAALRSLFDKVRAGDGQVVLVEGEAGIGKSRIVDELVGRLQRDGEDVDFLFGSFPPGGAATATGALSTAIREQIGEASLEEGLASRLGAARSLAPAFAALVSGSPPPPGAEPLQRDSVQSCFVAVARSFAAERPTVILVDDLHFATQDALALFASLALAVPGHRILLVGTLRPGLDERWLASIRGLPHASKMQLARLGPKDLAELLADSFKSERLATQLGHRIAVKSDGNPFFAFEIVRGLREGKFIELRDDGTWASTQAIAEISIPSTVMDLVNARVSGLDEAERNLLDVAACLGFEFDASLAGAALGLGRIPALQTFARVEKRDRLVRSAGRNFVFDHHQVQEALYGALPEMLREEYHAALAEAMESRAGAADPAAADGALCAEICRHFLEGARPDRAARWIDAAMTHLERGHMSEAAVKLSARALAAPGMLAGAARMRMLARQAARLDLLARRPAQRAAHEEALALARSCGDRAAEASALLGIGESYAGESRLAEALVPGEAALAISRESGDGAGEAAALVQLGATLHSQGRAAEAVGLLERALGLCAAVGNRQGEAAATGNLGNALAALGRFEEALACHSRHLELARLAGHRRSEAPATGNLGVVYGQLGRFRDSREHFAAHLAIATEVGIRRGEGISSGNLSESWRFAGRPDEARVHAERCLAISREIGLRMLEATAQLHLAALHTEAGEGDAARTACTDALHIFEAIGNKAAIAGAVATLADIDADCGDADAARRGLTRALELAEACGAEDAATSIRCELAALTGEGAEEAERRLHEGAARMNAKSRMACSHQLWRAGRGRRHLEEARRILLAAAADEPDDIRETMLRNVKLHREIMAEFDALPA